MQIGHGRLGGCLFPTSDPRFFFEPREKAIHNALETSGARPYQRVRATVEQDRDSDRTVGSESMSYKIGVQELP